MHISLFQRLLIGTVVWLLSAGIASAYLTDSDVHLPPEYTSFDLPAAGESFTDPVFGTSIRRLSAAPTMANGAAGGTLTWVMTEYSTMAAFNRDGSRLILQHDGYYGLYDGAGNFVRDLPYEISASSEPRWSRVSADLLYYLRYNQLKSYDVATRTTRVVRTFSEYAFIGGKGESDISFDGDHFVFHGDNLEIFLYRISTDQKGAVLATGGRGYDSLYVTPDNHVTVTWLQGGTSRYQGIELFDGNMSFLRQVAPAGGHMDIGRDADGSEVLVWANAADPTPICNNGVVKIRLSDAHETCLATFDWSLALNVSVADDGDDVFVATYAPGNPDPLSDPWPAYTNEIVQVGMGGGEVTRLAHHRSRPYGANTYNYTPRVTASRDGSKVVFSSNFGLQSQLGYPTQYSDAFLIAPEASTSSVGALPGTATLVSPAGTISDATPSYDWQAVTGATQYQVQVIRSGVGSIYAGLHDAGEVCSGGSCSLATPPVPTLADGDHTWRVRAFNDAGTGEWSAFNSFTVSTSAPPAAPTLVAPAGTITTSLPSYSWSASSGASKYQIHVIRSGVGSVYTGVYDSSSVCSSDACALPSPPVPELAVGDHVWRVRAYNASGWGDWSSFTAFTVSSGTPPAPTLLSPTGTISDTTPSYTWNESPGAVKYQLHVIHVGVAAIHSALHLSADICSGGTCTVGSPPVATLAPGDYIWRVRAFNAAGTGDWSSFVSFTVQ